MFDSSVFSDLSGIQVPRYDDERNKVSDCEQLLIVQHGREDPYCKRLVAELIPLPGILKMKISLLLLTELSIGLRLKSRREVTPWRRCLRQYAGSWQTNSLTHIQSRYRQRGRVPFKTGPAQQPNEDGEGATLPEPKPEAKSVADKSTTNETETLRDALVRMVLESGCELFHDRSLNTFVTVPVNGHRETWRLRSEGFRRLVRYRWHQLTGKGIGSGVVCDACDTLDATAAFTEMELSVHTRIAHHETGIYVDLCDDQWRAIYISANGWEIVENSPVRFIRTKGMLPLPVPKMGGSIDALRRLINAPTDEVWCLVVAWMLAAFLRVLSGSRPDGRARLRKELHVSSIAALDRSVLRSRLRPRRGNRET